MKISKRMTEIFAFLWILFFANLLVSIAQIRSDDNIFTLQAGTEMRVRMDNEINSKVSNVNDTFTATLSNPVVIRGAAILPAGAVVEGRIIEVKSAASGNKNGSFKVRFETLLLPTGAKRTIDADLINATVKKPSSFFSTIAIVGSTAIGAVLGTVAGSARGALIGAGLGAGAGTSAAFLKKGKEARIKTDEEFEIRLNKEVTLPVEDY